MTPAASFAEAIRRKLGFAPADVVATGRARGWVTSVPDPAAPPPGVVVGRNAAAEYLGVHPVRCTRLCQRHGVTRGRYKLHTIYDQAGLERLRALLAQRRLERGEAEVISAVRALRQRQWTTRDIHAAVLTASLSTCLHWLQILRSRGLIRCVREANGNRPALYETVHGSQAAQPMHTAHLHWEDAA